MDFSKISKRLVQQGDTNCIERPVEVWNGMVEGQELGGLRIMPTVIGRGVDSSTVIRYRYCHGTFSSASIHERPCC